MSLKSILFGVVVLGFFLERLASIKCYKCANTEPSCAMSDESLDGVDKTECALCAKIQATDGDETAINRGCGADFGVAMVGCETESAPGGDIVICGCEEELCNSGLSVQPCVTLIIGVTTMTLLCRYASS